MSDVIKIDAIADEIEKLLNQYGKGVVQIMEHVAVEVAKDGRDTLRRTSPKDTGEYAKSWAVKERAGVAGENKSYIIYNKKCYRLTHLLEYGHANRDGSRTPAKPHIKKVENQVVTRYLQEVERGLNDIK